MPVIDVSPKTKKSFKSLKDRIEVLENRFMDDNQFMLYLLYFAEKKLLTEKNRYEATF